MKLCQMLCSGPLLAVMLWQATGLAAEPDAWQASSPYQQLFYSGTIKTVQGRTLRIEPFCPGSGRFSGIQLVLEISGQPLRVHLGPQWYVEDQPLPLAYNSIVTATGVMVIFEQLPTMIAMQITTADGVMRLRDADGNARWQNIQQRPPTKQP